MNKRIVSILCCLALLVSCISGLGVIAETTAEQQACVTGATLTALNGAADAALLPTDDNLIAGKTKLSGSSGMANNNGTLEDLYDGLYQGINQDMVYQKNPDGSWSVSGNYVNYNVAETRYVSAVKAATATELGYAQIGFDLGATTMVETIAIGSTAEAASRKATEARFQEGSGFDGVETNFGTSTRLHMGTVYISDNADTLYDDANIAFTFDYLNGDISALSSTKAPLTGVYDLDTAVVGQYVGFRFYVAGVDSNTAPVSTTINGKTAKWGWWGQVRISELGVFGEKTATVSEITDGVNEDKIIAPENNILKNATATATGGTLTDVLYDGILCGVTDGYGWADAYGCIPSSGSADKKQYITWDLGTNYTVDSFLLAGSGVANTKYGANNLTIYVGDKTGAEIAADSTVAEPVYTSTDLILYGRHIALPEPAVGRYVVFEMTGYVPSSGTANAGRVWLTELAATGAPEANFTRMPVDSLDDLPNSTSLIAGKIPTNADGNSFGSVNQGSLDKITDGHMQGLDEFVQYTLTQEDKYKTVTYKNNTYYSYIAPTWMVEEQGLDTSETWYVRQNGGPWMHSSVNDTRVVFNSSNAKPVYDLGKIGRIDSILLASSTELKGVGNSAIYNGDYDASKHPQLTASQASLKEFSTDKRLLWTAKVYVGNTVNVFEEGELVLEYDLSANSADALRNLWTLKESVRGRYIGFDFTNCILQAGNNLTRVSELAVYGSTETEVATFDNTNYTDYAIAAGDNLLADRVADKSAPAVTLPDLVFDGEMSNMDVDYANGKTEGVPATCWEPTVGSSTEYLWLTFDMGVKQNIYSFLLAGSGVISGTKSYGVESVDLYVGSNTHTGIQAGDVQPDWSYDGNVTYGIRADFPGPLTGRYVVLRLKARMNSSYQLWISEIAAIGEEAPVTKEKTKKIVCVGDSITHGTVFIDTDYNAVQLTNTYPIQLERLLNDYDPDTDYEVVNAGISGSAAIGCDEIIPGTDTTFPASQTGQPTTWLVEQTKDTYKNKNKCVQQADTLLIMLGTNDAHARNDCWSVREPYYVEYYKKVIDAFRAVNPDVEIYVLTAPYTSVSTHYSNLKDRVVPLQKKMAAEWGLPVIDVWEATRHHVEDLNDGDLSSFIDDMDITVGLKLHPDEDGAAVIAQACFDTLTGAENDMYMVKANGGQLRGYEGGVPSGDLALRFSMTLPVTGITEDEHHNTQLTADSKITIEGTEYPVTGLGTVVGIKDMLDNPQIDLVAGLDKGFAKDVPAQKLYEVGTDSVTFTAVITNVDEAHYDTDLVARGYVQYKDGDVTRYAYGPVITRDASEVIAAHTMDVLNPTFDTWQGYQRMTFTAGGVECYLVMPDEPAEGNPWIWRTEFFGIIPTTDLELLEAGWALGYCRVSNMYGNPASVNIMKQFYDAAVPLANLDRQTVLEGFSRGGLYAVNYAATYPDTVAGVYVDAPVQDICSWPGSLYSDNTGDAGCWADCKNDYGFASDDEALADRTASPRWKYDKLIENEIPVLLVYGDQDNVVPFAENGQHLVDAYTNAGKTDLLKVHCVEGRGHTHGWTNEASAYIIANMNK